MQLSCALAGTCAGCPWITHPAAAQKAMKLAELTDAWHAAGLDPADLADLVIHDIAPGGLRDRVDLTLHREPEGMCLGLYDMDHTRIVDMETCPMMSPALGAWLADFRAQIPDLKLGSVRLRVSPDGSRGVWLDFPNAEIKRFLDEGTWLTALAAQAHVELGQRRKSLIRKEDGRLGLGDPAPRAWFETYLGDAETPCPLYCSVGGFTQPGFAANRALVARVRRMVRAAGGTRWLELGSGIGNFTLPLAAEGCRVTALENDPRANDGLLRSAAEAGLSDHIELHQANMHRFDPAYARLLAGVDGVLADPPRSGLRAFATVPAAMPADERPRRFIYVSCFAASLAADVAALKELGYVVREVEGLDQFPQSRHCEWLVRLERA